MSCRLASGSILTVDSQIALPFMLLALISVETLVPSVHVTHSLQICTATYGSQKPMQFFALPCPPYYFTATCRSQAIALYDGRFRLPNSRTTISL